MKKRIVVSSLLFFTVLFSILWYFLFSIPNNFPAGSIVLIERGLSLSATAEKLEKEGIIKSIFGFKVIAKILNKSRIIKSGEYLFKDSVSVFGIISRLSQGSFGFGTMKVLVPEGFANDDSQFFGGFKTLTKRILAKAKILKVIFFRYLSFFAER